LGTLQSTEKPAAVIQCEEMAKILLTAVPTHQLLRSRLAIDLPATLNGTFSVLDRSRQRWYP